MHGYNCMFAQSNGSCDNLYQLPNGSLLNLMGIFELAVQNVTGPIMSPLSKSTPKQTIPVTDFDNPRKQSKQ